MRATRIVMLPLAVMLAACGSSRPSAELVDARRTYDRARTGPAAALAPADVVEARRALDRAERADNGSSEERTLAYVAMRMAQVAPRSPMRRWSCPGFVDGERLRGTGVAHAHPRRPVEVGTRPVWGNREIAAPSSNGPCRGNTAVAVSVGSGAMGFGCAWSRSKRIGDS